MHLDDVTIQALGTSLRCINHDWMKPGTTGVPSQRLWYQGREPYFDVTVERTGDAVTWFQVTLRGRVVSWKDCSGQPYIQTGETDELDVPPQVSYYAASKTIRDGEAIDWPLVEGVARILAAQVDDPLLKQLSSLLQKTLPCQDA